MCWPSHRPHFWQRLTMSASSQVTEHIRCHDEQHYAHCENCLLATGRRLDNSSLSERILNEHIAFLLRLFEDREPALLGPLVERIALALGSREFTLDPGLVPAPGFREFVLDQSLRELVRVQTRHGLFSLLFSPDDPSPFSSSSISSSSIATAPSKGAPVNHCQNLLNGHKRTSKIMICLHAQSHGVCELLLR